MGLVAISCRYIWMNSSSATIAAGYLWPHSRPCSVWEQGASPHLISRSAAPLISPTVCLGLTPSYCVLLKQPDKQKVPSVSTPLPFLVWPENPGTNGSVVDGPPFP